MRGMIVLVLVIGAGLGWIVRSARVQRDAVAVLRSIGGYVAYDFEPINGYPTDGPAPGWKKAIANAVGPDFVNHPVFAQLSSVQTDANHQQALGRLGDLTHIENAELAAADATLSMLMDCPPSPYPT